MINKWLIYQIKKKNLWSFLNKRRKDKSVLVKTFLQKCSPIKSLKRSKCFWTSILANTKVDYRACICGLIIMIAGHFTLVVWLVQVDTEYPENESIESGAHAIAQAAYPCHHALRDSLLVCVGLVGYVGADRWMPENK